LGALRVSGSKYMEGLRVTPYKKHLGTVAALRGRGPKPAVFMGPSRLECSQE
jgi:hypothetical protein